MNCLDCQGTGRCSGCNGTGWIGPVLYDPEYGDYSEAGLCMACERGCCYACYGLGEVAPDSYQNYLAWLESPYNDND